MPLLGTCPGCGARRPLADYLSDAEARLALMTLCDRLSDWPGLVRRVPVYLGLHAPAQSAMAWPKCARLIAELADLVLSGQVHHDGQSRPCTPDLWAAGIDVARDTHRAGKLRLPLGDGHGWLRSVVFDLAGKESALAAAAQEASDRGETPIGWSPAHRRADPTGPTATPASDQIRELCADLAALRRLEQFNPGTHGQTIIDLESQLAALRRAAQPTETHSP